MTSAVDSNLTDNIVGFKVEGELNDYQVVEDVSESVDDDDRAVSNTNTNRSFDGGTLSVIPPSIVKPSSSPICGNVAVSHSENVIIGNNTYFNGPVTIKQVIHNVNGVENSAYVKNDDENRPEQYQDDSKANLPVKTFHLQKWHKIIISAACVVILSVLLAVLSIVLKYDAQIDSTSHSTSTTESASIESNSTKVVGMYYNYFSILITLTLVPLIILLTFCLLTFHESGMNKSAGYALKKKKTKVVVIDDYPCKKTVKKDDPLLIAPEHLRIVSRTDWLAQPVEDELDKIRQPVPWVVISHTATESCTTQSECVLRVRLIQTFHIESRKWSDIGYNFLVAGDGSAYIGRGWDYVGAHTLYYNKYSIGISFIGTFNNDPPPQRQLDACRKLLKIGVDSGKLAKDYKLFAHRQLSSTLSPGDKLYDIIKEWPHFAKNYTYGTELVPTY